MTRLEFRKLTPADIECRVGTNNKRGFSLLLYKNARVDMNILDETFGTFGWQRDHKQIKDVVYCGVGVKDPESGQWIWKWDAGSESKTEAEKGEASDSFKRACFNLGIGRELYTAPFIWINRAEERPFGYKVSRIGYEGSVIAELEIVDKDGVVVFSYPRRGGVRAVPEEPRATPKVATAPGWTKTDPDNPELDKEWGII